MFDSFLKLGTKPIETNFHFTITAKDAESSARTGVMSTAHGTVNTPLFLPVGTAATVKTLSPTDLRSAGAQMVLSNTYHLSQQPGVDVVEAAGGLARFMGWNGPTLTDSGGFQVFSLSATRKVTEEGVLFRSIYDGRQLSLTPESALHLQRSIGADIIYALDECSPIPATYDEVKRATLLTTRWAKRFMDEWERSQEIKPWYQAPFPVMQGGLFDDLRKLSADQLSELDPPGFGIGGLSVGETREEMIRTAALSCELLPDEKPRHLMGVGTPQDLLNAISVGVDMFDCVIPTRNGRNGQAFTSRGIVNLRNVRHKLDQGPLDPECNCDCCRTFTLSYLHHLTTASELLGMRLISLHNTTYYQHIMKRAQEAIRNGRFMAWRGSMEEGWNRNS
ncbi:MAG: tRNA guanosine(34) transglycosylase Tgt [Candidatus Electryoneaceae bacterium]|nr:tRNA guanosine(34) transglycosylase Tgt [Candidatus Electryoneaceae bacterium]